MKYIKGITIFVTLLFISSALTSNTSLNHLNNNQAYASIDIHNNFKEIGEKIKKACHAYQGNLDINIIKGLVTDVLKACLPHSNLPPTTPNPNPNPNVQNAILNFAANSVSPYDTSYQIWVSWGPNLTSGGPSTSALPLYLYSPDQTSVTHQFTIPVGYQYQIQTISFPPNDERNMINYQGDCPGASPNEPVCIGTMREPENTVLLMVCSIDNSEKCFQ